MKCYELAKVCQSNRNKAEMVVKFANEVLHTNKLIKKVKVIYEVQNAELPVVPTPPKRIVNAKASVKGRKALYVQT